MEQLNTYYPIMLSLQHQHCLVVGGGTIATRKIEGLLASGIASITVVAPSITAQLQQLLTLHEELVWMQTEYNHSLLQGKSLIFAATKQHKLNEHITNEALNCGILVCNVSDGGQGNFITPATISEGQLTIAVSTGGTSPALSKRLKQQLQSQFAKPYAEALELMSRLRKDLKRDKLDLERCAVITDQALGEVFQVAPNLYEQWYLDLKQRNM